MAEPSNEKFGGQRGQPLFDKLIIKQNILLLLELFFWIHEEMIMFFDIEGKQILMSRILKLKFQ